MPDTPQILIVEDDPSFREFLALLLGGQGYEPHTADSGRKAIAFLKFCVLDLVILDIGLPDMDGYEVLDNVREQCPTIPVIAMTGYSSVESAVDSLKRGAYDYLQPVTGTEFEADTAGDVSTSLRESPVIYYYVVTSVDRDGDESVHSREISPSTENSGSQPDSNDSKSNSGGGCFISTIEMTEAAYIFNLGL